MSKRTLYIINYPKKINLNKLKCFDTLSFFLNNNRLMIIFVKRYYIDNIQIYH